MAEKRGSGTARGDGKEQQAPKPPGPARRQGDQDPPEEEQQSRKIPGLNGYDPKLWPDVCR
ncbi:hypothetical protein FDW83_10960 [Pseudarthrobacter sp. NamE2]|uniref:hypothetical protein n=1 Tax=Pseudarthrobacter sp. NamE2 TaxID=2576838 RepID=UPI0010FE16D6|nr:hypothetical protein [Pseudarthrobacter sp. NamE2]TLM82917.1 hypothetical protein FDW83_10960 [Pseudarthrobacter sp. NamE2]